MKKLLLFSFSIVLFSYADAQLGQIQNGGFENWTIMNHFSQPDLWITANQENPGIVTVTQSSDAQHQLSALRLENLTNMQGDTIFAYAALGHVGQSGPDAGVPYSTPFNQVKGFYKSGNLVTGDTIYVLAIRFLAGSMTSFDLVPIINTNQTSYTAFSAPISNGVQDSLFIGVVCGNPFNNKVNSPGSFCLIDNFTLDNNNSGGLPLLPNYSFENWNTVSSEEPNYWFTANPLITFETGSNTTKSTDAYSGTYAAALETVLFRGTDTIPGLISIGAVNFFSQGNPFSMIPYNASPTTFSGYYKYTPVGGDIANISLIFYQGGSMIGVHQENISSTVSTYTYFTGNLSLTGTPDSIQLYASSGFNPGSIFLLDNLSLVGGNVAVENLASQIGFNLYPNPAKENITLELETEQAGDYTISIFDVTGQELLSYSGLTTVAGKTIKQIDIQSLASGLYVYTVTMNEKSFSKRFIVK